MNQISIDTVHLILNNFIKKIKQKNELYFEFKDNLYWCISEETTTNMSEKPEIIVGSIKDDIAFLNSLVEEDYDTNFLELERLSAVFKLLSIQLTL